MRIATGAVLVALAISTPAQARYLHQADARAGAGRVAHAADESLTVGRCWRGGTHIVTCSIYIDNARVPFTLNGQEVRGQAHLFAKVIQRGRRTTVSVF